MKVIIILGIVRHAPGVYPYCGGRIPDKIVGYFEIENMIIGIACIVGDLGKTPADTVPHVVMDGQVIQGRLRTV
jgi:hypothetical protein